MGNEMSTEFPPKKTLLDIASREILPASSLKESSHVTQERTALNFTSQEISQEILPREIPSNTSSAEHTLHAATGDVIPDIFIVHKCKICFDSKPEKSFRKLRCGHSFCRRCMHMTKRLSKSNLCPECRTPYRFPKGPQPKDGTMTWRIDKDVHLQGFEEYDTITINYRFRKGIQKMEHPKPGVPYKGTHREAYLPNSPEGQEVLQLLRKAFKARLIFNVGTSLTTGEENVVVWNDIHHKTALHGEFGYPDPDYLNRVKLDLHAKGINLSPDTAA